MKELKVKVKDFLSDTWDEIKYGLRMLCGKPTPMKRFVAVLTVGAGLAIVYLWFVVNSIYNIGKRDAENDFLKLQHIESLKLQSDSINSIKNYEFLKK